MNNEALKHKQACADRAQAIVQQQVNVMREIQRLNYEPTTELRMRLDNLLAKCDRAVAEYQAAGLLCDIPVYVTPTR
ncbi:hypothetical protein ABH945_007214 [Paraburkholderia sp. GAS333]|uniref:hypothetical protein n=1 Tax=Paraburkholderia sp. GAS333 TaxID=3156279 RepID=UPI003D1EBAC6